MSGVLPRIVITAEIALPQFAELCTVIKARGAAGAERPLAQGLPVRRQTCRARPPSHQPPVCFVCFACALQVPPLRVRPSDVRAMQAFFMREIARERNLPRLTLTGACCVWAVRLGSCLRP